MSIDAAPSYRLEVVPEPSLFERHPQSADTSGLILLGRFQSGDAYASPDLVQEVETLRDRGASAFTLRDNVYHATSSVALTAIDKHNALLSSRRLLEVGEPIVTGEITTDMGESHRHNGGLEDVYASTSPFNTHYSVVEGDTDYPVIFGIDTANYKGKPGFNYGYGDGIQLGPEVPAQHFATLSVPEPQLNEARAWAQESCPPDTLVMSHKAAQVLMYFGY